MMQLGRYHSLLLLVLLSGLAGCGGTSSAGLLPGPVWHPQISNVKAPSGSLSHGESVTFEVTWTGGRAPFSLEWDFVGGAEPAIVEATEPTASKHSVTVTLFNEGPEEKTFNGRIYLTDVSDNTASKAFSFTVTPPPPPDPPAEDPDDGTDPPDDGTDPPDDGTDPPDDGSDPPDDGTDPPDDGTDPPDDGTDSPDDGTDPPDDGTDPPDDGTDPPPVVVDPPPVVVNPPPPILS